MAQSGLRVVGGDHPIADAALKVTGGLVYGVDLELPRMLHARLLLSSVAHARIAAIDTSKAAALPGVIAVFSHLNAPAAPYSRYRILPGQALCPEDETLFAATARFVGDRVAAVVATDPQIAADAVALIEVDCARARRPFTRRAISCTNSTRRWARRARPRPTRSP